MAYLWCGAKATSFNINKYNNNINKYNKRGGKQK